MLVLPVFLTRHSSIKVRRENDCKDKTQILKIKKNQLILLNFNDNNRSVYQISIYSYLLVRIFNQQPFRSNICFYVICCIFVFFFALFLNVRCKFKLYFWSNAASSAFRLFSSSSLFQTLEAISCSCGISFSSVLHLESYCSMYPCIFCRAFTKLFAAAIGSDLATCPLLY